MLKNTIIRQLVFAAALFSGGGVWAAEWTFAGESQGIKTYTRDVEGKPWKDFKGVMEVNVSVVSVAAALADISTMHQWFFMLKEARYLDARPLDNCYVYIDVEGIWPVKPRDAAAHITVSQDPQSLEVRINVDAVPDYVKPREGYVRIPSMHSSWRLIPLSKNQTRIELIGNADPGGAIPMPILNMIITTMPKETLKGMRKHLKKPEYADLKLISQHNPRLAELIGRMKSL